MEEFIALHNRTVSRSEIERVITLAKEQNNTEVIYRLSRILNAYPTEQRFVINIKDYPAAPTALAGAHHTGDYREALDENGRLRKGYKFVSGKIIPPQPSQLSDDELTFLAAAGIDYFEQAPDDEAQGLGKPVPAADIYNMITDKIIKMLKSTKASDYKKTWEDDAFFIPLNFDSKKPYRGVNRMLLQERIGLTEAFANPYFLTFKQIKKHKGTLKKGAKGYEVVYYSIRYVVPADKNSGRKAYSSTNAHKVIDFLDKHKLPENIVTRIPMIRYYNVYNGEDITGIDFKLPEVKIGRAVPDTAPENQAAALIVENYPNPPAIKHGGNEAYYKLSEDLVRMPKIEQFDSVNDYYRTLFHELTHSTRHESRLNREKISFRFGDSGYAKEELVAEFGAVFLSAWAGIMWYNNKNHAAYLKGWNSAIKEAKNDNKFLMKAASLAQAATDYILNLDAAGQPAFLSKYEKPNKAEKPKKKAPASKIQIIPPYPIDIESNEENDDYMQLEKELSDLMGDKFEVWANNLIEQKRKARLAERSKEIKANIDTLKNKEKGATAYEYVRNEYGYNYKVDKKDTKKYEVTLTIYRYGSFNPNENYYDTFKTPEECSTFIIKTLDEQEGFYYSNWYGLSELQNKINELKGYQYSKQFNYQEEEKKAEKPKPEAQKAQKETKTTTALKFSDTETNKKMIEGYRNSSTGKINLLKTDMIGTQFHLSMFEKYMAIDDIAALYGKGRKAEAQKDYAFVKEHIEWAFNHNLRAAKEYDTIEQCTERFIELLPNLLAKGGQWLEAKANSKNSAIAKGQFTKVIKQAFDEIGNVAVGEKPNKAENPKPEAPKATEKADNTDKKYKFIAFYNSYGRINGIYSYQNLAINEFYLKNTFDDGIKVYAPLKSLEKIEEAKRIIEKQYIEGKDFICLKFESKKREEYYSLLIHSNEKPKPAAPKAPEKFPAAGTTKVFFTSQVDEIVDYVKKNGDNRGYINIDFTDKQTLKLLSQYGWGTYGFINTYDYPESAPKSKTKGVMSLKKIVSTDKLRIQITGVYIDSDYYIATNAISLIWVPRPKNDEYKTGWIFDANFKCKKLGGCKIEDYLINSDRFPIDRIREMQKAPIAYTSQQIDLTTLLDHLYRGYKAIRAINSTQEAIVITLQADKKIQYIDLKILIDLLDALRNNGAQTITFGFENLSGNSPIHISTDTQLQGFVMPRIFDENKVPTVKNCLMIAPLPLTLTEISKPTKGLSAPTDGTLFGKYPEISTDTFKDMKVSELRAFTLSYYLTHLKGKKVAIKNHLKEVIFTTKAGRKIAKGEAMYKEKAAVIERLEELIKNSTYNNWGSRKTQDSPNILGYLNFKSKLTIDGEKRHVRIAISLTRERKTELKNVEVGKKKSASFRKATVVNPQDGRNETLSANIPAKTVPNTLANQQINKLANPIIEKSTTPPRRGRAKSFCGDSAPTNTPAKTMPNTLANRQIDRLAVPTVYVEHLPEISTSANQNTLDAKMAALQTRNWETFVIANPQLQRFLGDVERKSAESTVITIAGGAGSGKTRFAFQFINALAQNYKVGHASLEEHPDSKLYYDKVQQYIDETALPNIEAPEIKDLDQLEALIQRNEVIVIDSFAKLQELNPRFLLDRDLRKKYDGKLFLLIYQLTGEGKMRGGSKSEYDGDIILLTHVAPDYRENYIYPSKNRYNALPATQLRYSTYFQQMLDIPQELGTGSRPPEVSSLPPAPQTNIYEVIY